MSVIHISLTQFVSIRSFHLENTKSCCERKHQEERTPNVPNCLFGDILRNIWSSCYCNTSGKGMRSNSSSSNRNWILGRTESDCGNKWTISKFCCKNQSKSTNNLPPMVIRNISCQNWIIKSINISIRCMCLPCCDLLNCSTFINCLNSLLVLFVHPTLASFLNLTSIFQSFQPEKSKS